MDLAVVDHLKQAYPDYRNFQLSLYHNSCWQNDFAAGTMVQPRFNKKEGNHLQIRHPLPQSKAPSDRVDEIVVNFDQLYAEKKSGETVLDVHCRKFQYNTNQDLRKKTLKRNRDSGSSDWSGRKKRNGDRSEVKSSPQFAFDSRRCATWDVRFHIVGRPNRNTSCVSAVAPSASKAAV